MWSGKQPSDKQRRDWRSFIMCTLILQNKGSCISSGFVSSSSLRTSTPPLLLLQLLQKITCCFHKCAHHIFRTVAPAGKVLTKWLRCLCSNILSRWCLQHLRSAVFGSNSSLQFRIVCRAQRNIDNLRFYLSGSPENNFYFQMDVSRWGRVFKSGLLFVSTTARVQQLIL